MPTAQNDILNEKPAIGEGVFTNSDVASILNVHKNRSRYLIDKYLNGKFKHSQEFQYKMQIGDRFSINFYALIELFVLNKFREKKIPISKVLELHDLLAKKLDTKYPFAKTQFLISGNEVYYNDLNLWVTGDKKFQIGISQIVEFFGNRIEFDNETGLAARFFPLGKNKTIVIDPEYRFGKPILKGTRYLVEDLYDLYLAEDKNKELIKNIFNISDQQIEDVIRYMSKDIA